MPESAHHALTLLIVFGAAKLLAEIFERMGVPGMTGEIFAGVLIGPAVLGWIQPAPFLNSLSELGVMFLLFRVGLEVKPAALFQVGPAAMLVATGGVVLPFFSSWGLMKLFGASHLDGIFMGAAMVATSVGITAQVLASRGLLWHKSSQTILAAAVFDDDLGLLVLALISSMAKGPVDFGMIATTVVMALLFVAIVGLFGTRAVDAIAPKMQQNLRLVESEFSVAMVLLFALSVAAIYVGVAAIVGAFLAGMALSSSSGQRLKDLSSGATELLVPFFLAGIGLQVQLGALKDPGNLMLCGALLVAAILSKLIGCGMFALGSGMRDRVRIGVGMIPRGEVGMVVAQMGLSMGVLSQAHYAILVIVCVATTMVAPSLLAIAYKGVEAKGAGAEYPAMH